MFRVLGHPASQHRSSRVQEAVNFSGLQALKLHKGLGFRAPGFGFRAKTRSSHKEAAVF